MKTYLPISVAIVVILGFFWVYQSSNNKFDENCALVITFTNSNPELNKKSLVNEIYKNLELKEYPNLNFRFINYSRLLQPYSTNFLLLDQQYANSTQLVLLKSSLEKIDGVSDVEDPQLMCSYKTEVLPPYVGDIK